ncbi:MAG: CAP domain-containing protein [Chloroflexota bacterium]
MLILTRRLVPVLLAGLLIVPLAGPVAAIDGAPAETVTDQILAQSAQDLVLLTNRQRAGLGLLALRIDPDLMAIAKARAEVMAATNVMSHTEPDGQQVFDHLNAAGLTWFSAGEIIAWNNYPTEPLSVAESIRAWMASPSHHAIMVSTGYNYVGYGAAVSASGQRYYAGVFVKEPDETGPWARFGSISRTSIDARHIKVTIRWTGGDSRLQVLTSGLSYYQMQWRAVGGAWHAWGSTELRARSATWFRGADYEVRLRSRDRAGNWGTWQTVRVNL